MAITTLLTTLATAAAMAIMTPVSGSPAYPVSVVVANLDATITIYLGGPTVTNTGSTTGIPLAAASSRTLSLTNSDILYAIPASGTPNVVVFSQGGH